MLRPAFQMKGYVIRATDGDIGQVEDFYFDDRFWTVRYAVVDTGKILPGNRVLISPIAIDGASSGERLVSVGLSTEQVENSPHRDADAPLSRQQEAEYFRYYRWPYYWTAVGIWGPFAHPRDMRAEQSEEVPTPADESGDPHLRSMNEAGGYHIQATDDEVGHIEDFIVDDETWEIRFLVIDTSNWWFGKKVLLPPHWIDRVGWSYRKAYVDLSREKIRGAPEWQPGDSVSPEYVDQLTAYYERAIDWADLLRR